MKITKFITKIKFRISKNKLSSDWREISLINIKLINNNLIGGGSIQYSWTFIFTGQKYLSLQVCFFYLFIYTEEY